MRAPRRQFVPCATRSRTRNIRPYARATAAGDRTRHHVFRSRHHSSSSAARGKTHSSRYGRTARREWIFTALMRSRMRISRPLPPHGTERVHVNAGPASAAAATTADPRNKVSFNVTRAITRDAPQHFVVRFGVRYFFALDVYIYIYTYFLL